MPWCIKKCPYCDFNSHNITNSGFDGDRYIEALLKDLTLALPLIWNRTINTIFIGGGTPSLFSANAINILLAQIRALVKVSPFAEITMEINPGTLDNSHISGYKTAGVNRVSLGIQSFNDKYLQVLGRIHDANTAREAINIALQYFTNVNLDIMYGLPKQTLAELVSDIEEALSFKTKHLSIYNLTIEPQTYFHKNVPDGMPDNDLCYQMQDILITKLAHQGFKRYEISAYTCVQEFQSKHNLNYWQFGDYLGIGAGAHSKISFYDKIIRQVRQKNPKAYMDSLLCPQQTNNYNKTELALKNDEVDFRQLHIIEDKILKIAEIPFEFVLNNLRLVDGFTVELYTARTGLPLNTILPQLLQAVNDGFINMTQNKVKPTDKGLDFLNDLLERFLPN